MEFEFLAKHNPWWKVKEAIVGDSKVSYAINKKKSYIPHLITKFKGNYSIRGPRQVGKTTALKLFIWECIIKLGVDPKKILYLPCDTLKDFREIVQAVELHREWLAELDIEENYVLFDEITFVSEWYKGIKYIIDQQLCTLLVFTGSLASDLKSGVERFPGRAVKNIFYLPLKFSEYVKLFGSNELRGTLNKIKLNTLLEDIEKGASILLPFLPELNRLLEKYLITGGFLKPSFQFHENKRIEEETYVDYVNWILGDLSKIEKSELFFREVINAIIKKYGTSLSYHSIAKKTSIGSHKTVSEYLELLDSLLLLMPLYRFDINKKMVVFRKQKKYYFLDPFLFSAFSGYVNSMYENYVNSTNKPFIIEGVVLNHLKRLSSYYMQNVWYYKDRKGEIDFILRIGKDFIPIEVKWQEDVNELSFKHYHIFHRRPLILSKRDFYKGKALIIPTAVFLTLI